MTGDLEALAARVEAATGPDRELDLAIQLAISPGDLPKIIENGREGFDGKEGRTWELSRGALLYEMRNDQGVCWANGGIPIATYTASLDAAMTLVPAGHTIQLSDWEHELLRTKGAWQAIVLPIGARGRMTDYTFSNRCDHAATPALALTAACLRAAASLAREPGEDRHG